ncbi:MAG: tol-pal system-associated acyl-CoA thioesterase [Gammaproteobacteria bacterium]
MTGHASQPSRVFSFPVRVYYEDTDLAGVVYYANYLRFMERARTEWLLAQGISQVALRDAEGLLFAVTAVDIRYLKPARFEDRLVVTVELTRRRRASLEVDQRILRDGPEGELLCTARVSAACLSVEGLRPRPIPGHLFREGD